MNLGAGLGQVECSVTHASHQAASCVDKVAFIPTSALGNDGVAHYKLRFRIIILRTSMSDLKVVSAWWFKTVYTQILAMIVGR